jgi:hypothetical protein
VKLAPSYGEAWLYLALTLEESGDRASAGNAFAEAARTATDASVRAQALQGASRVK